MKFLLISLLLFASCSRIINTLRSEYFAFYQLCYDGACYKIYLNFIVEPGHHYDNTYNEMNVTCSYGTALDDDEYLDPLEPYTTRDSMFESEWDTSANTDYQEAAHTPVSCVRYIVTNSLDDYAPKIYLWPNINFPIRGMYPITIGHDEFNSPFINFVSFKSFNGEKRECFGLEPSDYTKICMCENFDGKQDKSFVENYCRTLANGHFTTEMPVRAIYFYGEIQTQSRYATLAYTLKITLNVTYPEDSHFVCRLPHRISPYVQDLRSLGGSLEESSTQSWPYFLLETYDGFLDNLATNISMCHNESENLDSKNLNRLLITFLKEPIDPEENPDQRIHSAPFDLEIPESRLEILPFYVEDWMSQAWFKSGECRLVQRSPFHRYCYCMAKNRTADFCGMRDAMPEAMFHWQGDTSHPTPVANFTNLNETLYDLENLIASKNISNEEVDGAFVIIDTVMDVGIDNFTSDISSRFLSVLNHLTNVAQKIEYVKGKNLAVIKCPVKCGGGHWPQLEAGEEHFGINMAGKVKGNKQNSVRLAHEKLCGGNGTGANYSAVLYIMRNRKFFNPKSNIANSKKPCEQHLYLPTDYGHGTVLSGKLLPSDVSSGGDEIHQVEIGGEYLPMIQLSFTADNDPRPLHGSTRVAHWNGERWVAEIGQKIRQTNNIYIAEINHLTDFTLLVDGLETDPILCDQFLRYLSIVLNLLSITSLVLLALTILGRRSKLGLDRYVSGSFSSKSGTFHSTKSSSLNSTSNSTMSTKSTKSFVSSRSRLSSKTTKQHEEDFIRLLYYVFLAMFYICFTLLSDESQLPDWLSCNSASKISYFFLLSCITVTIFQSLEVVSIFSYSSKSERTLRLFSHPILVLSCTLAIPGLFLCAIHRIFPEIYDRNDSFCWIRPDYIFLAVILPLSGLLLNSVICFVLIFVKICQGSSRSRRALHGLSIFRRVSARRLTANLKKSKNSDKLLVLFCVQIMLGMPWIFQYLTISSPELVISHYIFTVAIGSQGIVLFILFCYRRMRLRNKEKSFADLTDSIRHKIFMISLKRKILMSMEQ